MRQRVGNEGFAGWMDWLYTLFYAHVNKGLCLATLPALQLDQRPGWSQDSHLVIVQRH